MRKLIDYFIHRSIFGNLVSIAIVVMGAYYFTSMQREAFSKVEFDIVMINTIYPGASPSEVEKLVTIPIERELKEVEGVKKMNSTSLDSRSGVILTLEPNITEKMKVLQDIRDATDRAKTELPDDAEDPIVAELTSSRTPIIEISLNSDPEAKKPLTEYQLRNAAKTLQDNLEQIKEVASVTRRGYRDREIFIEVDPIKMYDYNISSDEIVSALATRNLNFPGGTIKGRGKEYNIRTVQEFENASEINDVILRYNDYGGAIRISDVAYVKDSFEEKSVLEKANGREAIVLTVLKKEKADAIDLVDRVKEDIAKFEKEKPTEIAQLQISTMNDISFFIRRRLSVLGGNVLIGIILVLASLFFFLGWRVALMVAFGIPFSFAITFIVMGFTGISINLISMFGLIIVSGMIVDDAIVVGENIYRLIEKGVPPLKAAVTGAQEMLLPVIAAVTTTMVAFMPLMFMGGIMGKFIWTMPAAVIIALGASLFESFFILPSHVLDITNGKELSEIVKNKSSLEYRIFAFLQKVYKKILVKALNYRYLVIMLIMGLFFVAIGLIKATGFSLFPKVDIDTFFIKAETTHGISLEEMGKRIQPYEDAVLNLREGELDSFNTRVGILQENPSDPFVKRGNNFAMLAVFLSPETNRERKARQILAFLQQQLDPKQSVLFTQITQDKKSTIVLHNLPEVLVYSGLNRQKKIPIPDTHFIAGGGLAGNTLYVYSGENVLFTIDMNKGNIIDQKKVRDNEVPLIFSMEPSGEFAVIYFDSGELYSLELKTGEMEYLTKYRDEQVSKIEFLNDSKTAIIGTDKGSFEIWEYSLGATNLEEVSWFKKLFGIGTGDELDLKKTVDAIPRRYGISQIPDDLIPGLVKIEPERRFALAALNSGVLCQINMEIFETECFAKYSGVTFEKITYDIDNNLVKIHFESGQVAAWKFNDTGIVETVDRTVLSENKDFKSVIAEPTILTASERESLKVNTEKPWLAKAKKWFLEQKETNWEYESLARIEHIKSFDNGKTIWFGTFDGRLIQYDIEQEKFLQFHEVTAKPIYWLEKSGENRFWLSTVNKMILFNLVSGKIEHTTKIKGIIQQTVKAPGAGTYYFGTNGILAKKATNNKLPTFASLGNIILEKLQFKELRGGPPIGEPISIQIRGDEFKTLREISDTIQLELSNIRGVFDIRDNWESDKEEYHVTINERRAARAGVSVMQIASTIQTAFDGNVATSIKKVDEEIDIRVIFPEKLRNNLSSLQKVTVRNTMGNLVSINELAGFKRKPGINVISHEDSKRTITVQANIDEKKNSAVDANAEILRIMESKLKQYPGYSLNAGGEVEDTNESMGGLVQSAFIALLAIGAILVLLFGNLRHPRVIMIVIPLGIIGVAIAFFVHKIFDRDLVLSFMATLGIVGLIGVVVNDSIVFVDFINKMRHLGFSKRDSIIEAGLSRLRPVILTTITTVFGLLPTAYGFGGNDPFLKPMALAMAWGLMFATVITLIVIPSYYSIWEDRGYVFHKYILGGKSKNGRS
ncbi:MAG: efflux RND transporter permease subunit [Leptospirales bacterium]